MLRTPTPPTKSRNVFPSTSVIVAPRASAATIGPWTMRGRATAVCSRSSISRDSGPGISVRRSIMRVAATRGRLADAVAGARVALLVRALRDQTRDRQHDVHGACDSHEEPFGTLDASPLRPKEDVHDRREGEEDEPERGEKRAFERLVDPIAEVPHEAERDPRSHDRGEND